MDIGYWNRLQSVQNYAARIVFKKKKSDGVSHLLKDLHWLPIKFQIDFKIACLVYKCLNSMAPLYLRNYLTLYRPARNLRSSLDTAKLLLPKMKHKSLGERSFNFYGPKIWNELPQELRESQSIYIFKRNLKTFYLTKVF